MQVVDKMEKAGAGSLEVTARQRKKNVVFLVETEVKVVDSATLSGVSSGRGLDDLDSWWNVGISNGGCGLRSTQSALGASRWEGPSQVHKQLFVVSFSEMWWCELRPFHRCWHPWASAVHRLSASYWMMASHWPMLRVCSCFCGFQKSSLLK